MGWKEKEWKKNRNRKDEGETPSEMEKEILRMKGLILCDECFTAYSLYLPRCPKCDESNKTHYPAKL